MTSGDLDAVASWLQDTRDLALFDRNMAMPPNGDTLRELWKFDLVATKPHGAYWFAVEDCSRKPVAFGGLQSINYVHGDAVLPILVTRLRVGGGSACALRLSCSTSRSTGCGSAGSRPFSAPTICARERLTQRAGFQQEGRLREAWFVSGRHLDCLVVGLLREEWRRARDALRAELGGSIEIVHASVECRSRPPEDRG